MVIYALVVIAKKFTKYPLSVLELGSLLFFRSLVIAKIILQQREESFSGQIERPVLQICMGKLSTHKPS